MCNITYGLGLVLTVLLVIFETLLLVVERYLPLFLLDDLRILRGMQGVMSLLVLIGALLSTLFVERSLLVDESTLL
jgi:hypothetical protein